MSLTLTDCYVAAALRLVPDKSRRQEIRQELRAEIAGDIQSRVQLGATSAEAEHAVLTELGEPTQVANRYVTRPLSLIGPNFYRPYLYTLRAVGWSVLPIVAAVLAVCFRADEQSPADAIFGALQITLNVAVYLAVLVTLIFVVVERERSKNRNANSQVGEPWTPEKLPLAEQTKPLTWSRMTVWVVMAAVFIGGLFVQQVASPVTNASGASVPVIDPTLWHLWIPYLIVVVVLGLVLEAIHIRLGGWSIVTAAIGTVLTLAGTIPFVVLFDQARVLNHELARIGAESDGAIATPDSWISWLAVVLIVALAVGLLVPMWRSALAHRASKTAAQN